MPPPRRLLLLGLLFVLGVLPAQAQFAALRGRVVDASDGQPMPGVNVLLEDEDRQRTGTATNADGYFVLTNLPPARYVLTASFVGYAAFVDTLEIGFGEQRTLDVELVVEDAELGELVVESERGGTGNEAYAGFEKVRPSVLSRVPMPGLSADLLGYLLTMPGVVTSGDRGGQIFIRGGTPTQNLVMIDGMTVYQPFHIVGFYSVFPADIVAYADVYAGGFGARYGGRISSVIDVATRNGNKKRLEGAVSVAPFLSSARVEIPFIPDQLSILASVRESVIERVAPRLLGESLPYRFGDRFLKVHAFLNKTTSLSLTGLRSYDEGNVANTEGLGERVAWRNEAYGGRYLYLPSDMPVLAEVALYTTRYESEYGPEDAPERTAEVVGFNAAINFAYLFGANELRFGIFGRSHKYQYNFGFRPRDFKEFLGEGGAFVEGRVQFDQGLRLEPGLRLHSFPSRSQVTLEPRLLAVWRPDDGRSRHQFSAAWGLYHQQIIGLNAQRDVTDTFTAWAPSPPNTEVPRAAHFTVGWQQRPLAWLEITTEAYHKALDHVVVPLFSEELEREAELQQATGVARGVDLKVEVSRAFFYGYAGYGLSEVRYEREGRRFNPPHDRRHQLNVLARLVRGPYAVGLRWQYGSGMPFTQINGFYEEVEIPTAAPDYRTDPGRPAVSFDEPYEGRLPSYHRLDLSAERVFRIGPMNATLQASVINIYDRANLFDFDLFTGRRIDQLPLIPSLGLKVETN